ncbi:MAG: translation initiation factor IF-3 [Patescibacteria group bacterium]
MRISRKRRPQKLLIPRYNRNDFIRSPEVRLIDEEGKNLGVFATAEAIGMAQEREMDLVEINPKAAPPVAQIINFAHFKYQKEKEARKQKAKSKESEVKGIRLSLRISDHDMGIRVDQGAKFLERGDKLKVEIILRGRENRMSPLAFDVIKNYFALVNQIFPIMFEQPIARQANKVTALIARK